MSQWQVTENEILNSLIYCELRGVHSQAILIQGSEQNAKKGLRESKFQSTFRQITSIVKFQGSTGHLI